MDAGARASPVDPAREIRPGAIRHQADRLDHLVINVLFELDAAAALFSSLGFQLTARGHHSLGSINHLIMLPGCYLELIGLPLGSQRLRQEVLDSPLGASGLVFASEDIEATRAWLSTQGFEAAEIKDFSRPVQLDGTAHAARFRTVAASADVSGAAASTPAFAAGRVYWCQHLTPELVWRAPWLMHDNGLLAIESLVVQSTNAPLTAQRLAQAAGASAAPDSGGWQIQLADGFRLIVEAGPRDQFAGIGLAFSDLSLLAARAGQRDDVVWTAHGPHHASLTVPALDLALHCRQAQTT